VTVEDLERLTAADLLRLRRDQLHHLRNARGWRAQARRIRRGGLDPSEVLARAQEAEAEAERIDNKIQNYLELERRHRARIQEQEADWHERQRQARLRFANQARRIGQALPDKEE
jgi:hypothetical protein